MRGDGRLFRRKNSSVWWCAYYLRGKEYRQSTEENEEKAAKRFLKRKLDEIGADRIGAKTFAPPKHERVTVDEILDDLIAHYERGGKKGIPRKVSPQMRSHLRRLRDFFGSRRAMQVGSRDVETFTAELKAEKKANATVNRSLQLLSQAYRYAVNCDPPKLSRALRVARLDESGNRRKGKFTPMEAETIARSLPPYMGDVARFAYETGARAGEILQLRWSHLDPDAIRVPAAITKNREERSIALTEELEEILDRRKTNRHHSCDLIFHRDGEPISDYRKCWHSACVSNGLGAYFCRDCRDAEGGYGSKLNAEKKCPRCGRKWCKPRYMGRIFHDFRRSAAYEMWKAGNSENDCMKVTGHKTASMFKRYADLFSEEEGRAHQREVQNRRREWKKAQPANVVTMSKKLAVQ